MGRPWKEWADRAYLGPRAKVAHLVPWGNPYALCGKDAVTWYGTGTWDEREKAQGLQLCSSCLDHVDQAVSA